jgi:hypothetical protein
VAEVNYGGLYLGFGGAALRNCLVARNTALGTYGGLFLSNPSSAGKRHVVENCTVAGNTAVSGAAFAIIASSSGAKSTVTNAIVFANSPSDYADSDATPIGYSCAPELPHGVGGNTTNNPVFVNAASGDYHIANASPCLDTGRTLDWMTSGSLDLDGAPRILPAGGAVDMGAYEAEPAPSGTIIYIR